MKPLTLTKLIIISFLLILTNSMMRNNDNNNNSGNNNQPSNNNSGNSWRDSVNNLNVPRDNNDNNLNNNDNINSGHVEFSERWIVSNFRSKLDIFNYVTQTCSRLCPSYSLINYSMLVSIHLVLHTLSYNPLCILPNISLASFI